MSAYGVDKNIIIVILIITIIVLLYFTKREKQKRGDLEKLAQNYRLEANRLIRANQELEELIKVAPNKELVELRESLRIKSQELLDNTAAYDNVVQQVLNLLKVNNIVLKGIKEGLDNNTPNIDTSALGLVAVRIQAMLAAITESTAKMSVIKNRMQEIKNADGDNIDLNTDADYVNYPQLIQNEINTLKLKIDEVSTKLSNANQKSYNIDNNIAQLNKDISNADNITQSRNNITQLNDDIAKATEIDRLTNSILDIKSESANDSAANQLYTDTLTKVKNDLGITEGVNLNDIVNNITNKLVNEIKNGINVEYSQIINKNQITDAGSLNNYISKFVELLESSGMAIISNIRSGSLNNVKYIYDGINNQNLIQSLEQKIDELSTYLEQQNNTTGAIFRAFEFSQDADGSILTVPTRFLNNAIVFNLDIDTYRPTGSGSPGTDAGFNINTLRSNNPNEKTWAAILRCQNPRTKDEARCRSITFKNLYSDTGDYRYNTTTDEIPEMKKGNAFFSNGTRNAYINNATSVKWNTPNLPNVYYESPTNPELSYINLKELNKKGLIFNNSIIHGFDMPNGDKGLTTINECIDYCNNDPNCLAASLFSQPTPDGNTTCVLKTKIVQDGKTYWPTVTRGSYHSQFWNTYVKPGNKFYPVAF